MVPLIVNRYPERMGQTSCECSGSLGGGLGGGRDFRKMRGRVWGMELTLSISHALPSQNYPFYLSLRRATPSPQMY